MVFDLPVSRRRAADRAKSAFCRERARAREEVRVSTDDPAGLGTGRGHGKGMEMEGASYATVIEDWAPNRQGWRERRAAQQEVCLDATRQTEPIAARSKLAIRRWKARPRHATARLGLTLIAAAAALTVVLSAVSATATIITYSGQDDGAPVGGPFPASAAAQSNFLAAASGFGAPTTETFEELAVGTASGGGTFAITGASVTVGFTTGGLYSGVSNQALGNLYGFNVTPNGSNWLGFPGTTVTFDFTQPTHSFGFYTTGVQSILTSMLTVAFDDGASEQLAVPINVNGGASYFGFTDTAPFSSVTISNLTGDAWGIDDVAFNLPEPASWMLLPLALAALAWLMEPRPI